MQPFARTDPSERDGEDLLSLVKRVKPTVLVLPASLLTCAASRQRWLSAFSTYVSCMAAMIGSWGRARGRQAAKRADAHPGLMQ